MAEVIQTSARCPAGRKGRSTVVWGSSASLCPALSSMVEPNPKEEAMSNRTWEMHFSVSPSMAATTVAPNETVIQPVSWPVS